MIKTNFKSKRLEMMTFPAITKAKSALTESAFNCRNIIVEAKTFEDIQAFITSFSIERGKL